jgi:hypothetical protein
MAQVLIELSVEQHRIMGLCTAAYSTVRHIHIRNIGLLLGSFFGPLSVTCRRHRGGLGRPVFYASGHIN